MNDAALANLSYQGEKLEQKDVEFRDQQPLPQGRLFG